MSIQRLEEADANLLVDMLPGFFLLVMALLVPECAQGQPTGTWTTHFGDGDTAWLVIEPGRLVVVNQNQEGKCMSVQGRVKWDGLTPMNRDWTVRKEGDRLAITFPATFSTDTDTTVHYRRTTEDPIKLCQNEQGT